MAKGKTKAKFRNKKSVETHFLGDEPFIAEVESSEDIRYTKALNWYSYMCDKKQGREWLIQWMKDNGYSKEDISSIRKVHDNYLRSTPMWIARMLNNGSKLLPKSVEFLKANIQESIKSLDKNIDVEETVRPKKEAAVSIQDRTLARNRYVHTLAEELVDKFAVGESVSFYDFLVANEATASAASYILDKYKPIYKEVMEDSPDIRQAYGSSLAKWRKFWKEVITDLERYIGNKKATKVRKPRAKKEQPLSKVIAKLKYQKESSELKLVSVDPQKMIGANQVWVYNTKARKIAVYHAQGPSGIGVKGTTLTGFDPEKSIEKTVRKPEVVTAEVLNAGKVQIRKLMDGINAKAYSPTGRMNDASIILRVIK